MKLNVKKPKLNIPLLLSVMIVVILLAEVVAAYFFWFQNSKPQVVQVANDNIVRVDLPGYRSVIQMLDEMEAFEPGDSGEFGNPFLYR